MTVNRPPAPQLGYWGIRAIAARMGVRSDTTIYTWYRTKGFVMYLRHRYQHKACWYTNDTLITHWELSRAHHDRVRDRERRDRLGIKSKA